LKTCAPVANRRSLDARRAMFGCSYAALWGSFTSCGPDFIGSTGRKAGLRAGMDTPEPVSATVQLL
jgi:hypothetical protein